MFNVFLFTVLFVLLGWLICRSRFVAACGLSSKTLLLLYSIKVFAACAVCFSAHIFFNDNTDYNGFNTAGISEYELLMSQPAKFFTDIFQTAYKNYGNVLGAENNYWKDLAETFITKLLAVFNIASRGNIYINALFFAGAGFFGHIALYKLFNSIYPNKKWQIISGCFLLPSFLFYSSGIHKDQLAFLGFALFLYALYFCVEDFFSVRRFSLLIASLLLILLARNFLAFMIVPFAILYTVANIKRARPAIVVMFAAVFLISVAVLLHLYVPAADPLALIAAKQKAFLSLGFAATQYQNMHILQPAWQSFVEAAPSALQHAFLSPYPGEFKNIFCNILSAEMMCYWLLFLLSIRHIKLRYADTGSFTFVMIYFTILILLFAGYITPNAGALVRYRSIYLPFILTPILCNMSRKKLRKEIH